MSARFLSTDGPVFVLAARCAGAALGLAIQFVLARAVGATELGNIFIVLAASNLLAVVATLGYPSVCVRFVRRYMARDRCAWLPRFVETARKETTRAAVILAILVVAIAWTLPALGELRWPLTTIAAMIPALVSLSVNGGLANAYKRIDISYIPEVFLRPLIWLFGIGLLWLTDLPLNAGSVLVAALVSVLAAAILQKIALSRVMGDLPSAKNPGSLANSRRPVPLWRKAAMPMIATTLLTGLIFDVDALFLSMLQSAQSIAVFGICFKIAFLVAFGVHVTQQSVMPQIADAYTANLKPKMALLATTGNALGIGSTVVAFILVLVFGEHILGLFGEIFVSGYPALLILMMCPIVRAVCGPGAQVLVLAGKQRTSLIIHGGGLAVLALINVPLVGLYDVTGAAAALLVATAIWSGGLALAARLSVGVNVAGISLPLNLFVHRTNTESAK